MKKLWKDFVDCVDRLPSPIAGLIVWVIDVIIGLIPLVVCFLLLRLYIVLMS